MDVTEEELAGFFSVMLPLLDERQVRLMAAALAQALGHGGKSAVARASGLSRNTVLDGQREIDGGEAVPSVRVRRPGAGRKAKADEPGLLAALEALVDPESRGDPMSPLRWTLKSTRGLAREMTAIGHEVSSTVVGQLLRRLGFTLQAPSKVIEGSQHPDRDGQFRYLNGLVAEFLGAGEPVISVDTKKKELVGDYDNGGREWQPKGAPVEVADHDFPDPDMAKAVPYGVYDVGADEGWVSVGTSGDTGVFAVASIRSWWETMGRDRYPDATRLLVTADCGGSNGYRTRLWKVELSRLARDIGVDITVCHYPPGTSKWNKIEHRLFSHITINWRGRPLTSYRTIVELIGATTTRTGLTVRAELDQTEYPRGIKVTDDQIDEIGIQPHDWHGQWNYTIPNSPAQTIP